MPPHLLYYTVRRISTLKLFCDNLFEIGSAFEAQEGKVLEDDMNRWNYLQGAPMAALQDFMSMITGNYGSTSTSSSRQKGSPLNTILGAGMTAASMF